MSIYICFAPLNGFLSKKVYSCLLDIAAIKGNSHIVINALLQHIA